MSRRRRLLCMGLAGMAVLLGVRAESVNIAPQALAIASVYTNPINDGKPVVFGTAPAFADGKSQTGYRLVGDQPGRLEFHFDRDVPVSPGRCEVLTQMEMITAGHVEVLRRNRWERVAELSTRAFTVVAQWEPEPVQALAVVIETTTDLDHEPIRVMEVRWYDAQPPPVPKARPRIGLSTEQPQHVFALGETVKVECRIVWENADRTGWKLHWRWDNFINDPVDAGGSRSSDSEESSVLELNRPEQGPLLLKVWLADERTGVIAAASSLLVGVRDPAFPASVPSLRPVRVKPLPTRAGVTRAMHWGAELYHRMLAAQFKPGRPPFAAFARAGVDLVAAYQDLAWFEPLPGVYNFAAMDGLVRLAEEHGLNLELGLWRWYYGGATLDGATNLQYWLEPYSATKRDGSKGPRWLNVPSLHAAEYRESVLRTTEVFLRRYRQHPSVAIWHLHPFGVVDHDFTSSASAREDPLDYSSHARRAYASFLEGKYGTIDRLNARYHSFHRAFVAVPIPEPAVEGMTDIEAAVVTIDNRPERRDYLEFRDQVGVQGFQRRLYALARELDPERPIGGMSNSMTGSAVAEEITLRLRWGVYYGDQNTESPAFIRRYLGTAAGRLPFRGEDHSPISPRRFPGDYRARMNAFFFNCAVVGVGQLNYVFPVWEENPAWDMFASPSLRAAFAGNKDTTVLPSEIGLLHSFDTAALEGFTAYAYIELHRWLDLLAWSEAATTPGLWTEPLRAETDELDLTGKRLLIDNDSRLLTRETAARLVAFVRQGGDLMVQRTSGQYEPGEARPTWHLLRALGYEDIEGLGKPLLAEGVANGTGPLSGLQLPMRDVVELRQTQATPMASIEGKAVAVTWRLGRGRVLLLGGTLGDYALAENRRRLLEGRPGAWEGWEGRLSARTQLLSELTDKLRQWSHLPASGIVADHEVRVMARKTSSGGYSISVRNPQLEALQDVAFRLPLTGVPVREATVTFPDRTERIPLHVSDGEMRFVLPIIPAGGFCFIQW